MVERHRIRMQQKRQNAQGACACNLAASIAVAVACTAQALLINLASSTFSASVHDSLSDWLYPSLFQEVKFTRQSAIDEQAVASRYDGNSYRPGDSFAIYTADQFNVTLFSIFDSYFALGNSAAGSNANATSYAERDSDFERSSSSGRCGARAQQVDGTRSCATTSNLIGRLGVLGIPDVIQTYVTASGGSAAAALAPPSLWFELSYGGENQESRRHGADPRSRVHVPNDGHGKRDAAVTKTPADTPLEGLAGTEPLQELLTFHSVSEFEIWTQRAIADKPSLLHFTQSLVSMQIDLQLRSYNPAAATVLGFSSHSSSGLNVCTLWDVVIIFDFSRHAAITVSLDSDFTSCGSDDADAETSLANAAADLRNPLIWTTIVLLLASIVQLVLSTRECWRRVVLIRWAVVLGQAARFQRKYDRVRAIRSFHRQLSSRRLRVSVENDGETSTPADSSSATGMIDDNDDRGNSGCVAATEVPPLPLSTGMSHLNGDDRLLDDAVPGRLDATALAHGSMTVRAAAADRAHYLKVHSGVWPYIRAMAGFNDDDDDADEGDDATHSDIVSAGMMRMSFRTRSMKAMDLRSPNALATSFLRPLRNLVPGADADSAFLAALARLHDTAVRVHHNNALELISPVVIITAAGSLCNITYCFWSLITGQPRIENNVDQLLAAGCVVAWVTTARLAARIITSRKWKAAGKGAGVHEPQVANGSRNGKDPSPSVHNFQARTLLRWMLTALPIIIAISLIGITAMPHGTSSGDNDFLSTAVTIASSALNGAAAEPASSYSSDDGAPSILSVILSWAWTVGVVAIIVRTVARLEQNAEEAAASRQNGPLSRVEFDSRPSKTSDPQEAAVTAHHESSAALFDESGSRVMEEMVAAMQAVHDAGHAVASSSRPSSAAAASQHLLPSSTTGAATSANGSSRRGRQQPKHHITVAALVAAVSRSIPEYAHVGLTVTTPRYPGGSSSTGPVAGDGLSGNDDGSQGEAEHVVAGFADVRPSHLIIDTIAALRLLSHRSYKALLGDADGDADDGVL